MAGHLDSTEDRSVYPHNRLHSNVWHYRKVGEYEGRTVFEMTPSTEVDMWDGSTLFHPVRVDYKNLLLIHSFYVPSARKSSEGCAHFTSLLPTLFGIAQIGDERWKVKSNEYTDEITSKGDVNLTLDVRWIWSEEGEGSCSPIEDILSESRCLPPFTHDSSLSRGFLLSESSKRIVMYPNRDDDPFLEDIVEDDQNPPEVVDVEFDEYTSGGIAHPSRRISYELIRPMKYLRLCGKLRYYVAVDPKLAEGMEYFISCLGTVLPSIEGIHLDCGHGVSLTTVLSSDNTEWWPTDEKWNMDSTRSIVVCRMKVDG